jgi:hypothetical protein
MSNSYSSYRPSWSSSPGSSGDDGGLLLVLLGVGALAAVAQVPQIAFGVGAVVVGLIAAGVLLYHRWRRAAAGVSVAALVGVAAVWAFVPWDWKSPGRCRAWLASEAQTKALAALRPNDVDGFLRRREERLVIARTYPDLFAARLVEAERSWLTRSAQELGRRVEDVPLGEVKSLRELDGALERLEKVVEARDGKQPGDCPLGRQLARPPGRRMRRAGRPGWSGWRGGRRSASRGWPGVTTMASRRPASKRNAGPQSWTAAASPWRSARPGRVEPGRGGAWRN